MTLTSLNGKHHNKKTCTYIIIIFLLLMLILSSCSEKSNSHEVYSPTINPTQSSLPLRSTQPALTEMPDSPSLKPLESFAPVSTESTGTKAAVSATPHSAATPKPAATSQKVNKTSPTPTPTPNTISLTFPEGFTAAQIGERLEANGVCKKADFLSAINSYNFSSYSLVAKIPSNANRCFKLEGYLYPDRYNFYLNSKAQDAIAVFLKNAETKLSGKYSYQGMPLDDIIILASIIEKEAAKESDMKKISSVFHNRLKAGMRLQSDSTIIYIEKYIKPNIMGNKERYNSYYNTYKCYGLPAGPICNPGATALNAAVNPANTDYLYFCSDESGNYYFAVTYAEHLQNCEKAGVKVS